MTSSERPHGAVSTRPSAEPRRGAWWTAVAVLIGAALAFHGLSNHKFWDDEGNTAVFARNWLATGELRAWDGANLIAYGGGAELDEELLNVYMPPLQYWVAAAGLRVFGETTFGARVPFVLVGLATIAMLAVWTRRFLGDGFPWYAPALLLAASPAFLLYIRNCRYYALGVFFTVVVLIAWASPLRTARGRVSDFALAGVGTLGLWASHYVNAMALVMALPLFFVLAQYRTRRHVALFGWIAAITLVYCLWIFFHANPYERGREITDTASKLVRSLTLMGWHVRDLAMFEFVPVALIAPLVYAFVSKKYRALRPLAGNGLLVVGMLLVSCIATGAVSPQPTNLAEPFRVAAMRLQVPTIALGAVMAAIALVVLWRMSASTAVAAAALLVLTNTLHLGFLQPKHGFEKTTLTCRLWDYVSENLNDYETVTEQLIAYLEDVPDGTVVLFLPEFMMYAPMFYLPELRYYTPLADDMPIAPHWREQLPHFVFQESAEVDLAIIAQPGVASAFDVRTPDQDEYLPVGEYTPRDELPTFAVERSRPEIPWHSFSPADITPADSYRYIIYDVRRLPPQVSRARH